MDKRIETMQRYLDEAYMKLQELSIQATEQNTHTVYIVLRNIQIVYNTLKDMLNKDAKEKPDERISEAE